MRNLNNDYRKLTNCFIVNFWSLIVFVIGIILLSFGVGFQNHSTIIASGVFIGGTQVIARILSLVLMATYWKNDYSEKHKFVFGIIGFLVTPLICNLIFIDNSTKYVKYLLKNEKTM